MDADIKKLDEIWTSDGKKLGLAQALFHRPEEEIDPAVKYYASYLEVENFDYGSVYFVPSDFIADREATDKIQLTVTFDQVANQTWFRRPDFVARGQARQEELKSK